MLNFFIFFRDRVIWIIMIQYKTNFSLKPNLMIESFDLIRFSHVVRLMIQWFVHWSSDSMPLSSRLSIRFLKLCPLINQLSSLIYLFFFNVLSYIFQICRSWLLFLNFMVDCHFIDTRDILLDIYNFIRKCLTRAQTSSMEVWNYVNMMYFILWVSKKLEMIN